MFGGQVVYRDGLMVALELGGELYLKADEENVSTFRGLGSPPFVYQPRDRKALTMSYWSLPDSAPRRP